MLGTYNIIYIHMHVAESIFSYCRLSLFTWRLVVWIFQKKITDFNHDSEGQEAPCI